MFKRLTNGSGGKAVWSGDFLSFKVKVLFLGVDEKKHPGKLPRTYTLMLLWLYLKI